MTDKKDLTGLTAGKWTVLAYSHNAGIKNRPFHMWQCRCECGTERPVLGTNLTAGTSKSCGCVPAGRTHGMSKTRTFKVWLRMRARCNYPCASKYADYGGRGIKVCDRWNTSFVNFLEDMGHPPTAKHTIDRTDPDGNYEPGNCTWATWQEQQQNQRRTKLNPEKVLRIREIGTSMSRRELAAMFGVVPHMIDNVLKGKSWNNIGGTIRRGARYRKPNGQGLTSAEKQRNYRKRKAESASEMN